MTIKTLSEILVEMGETPVSADHAQSAVLDEHNFAKLTKSPSTAHNLPNNPKAKKHHQQNRQATSHTKQTAKKSADIVNKKSATAHQQTAATPPTSEKLATILESVTKEPLVQTDRANNYLRWLAFYYLSRRELSQHQLRQKLLAKGCDPEAVEALLIEFADKGYQSDKRCAAMIVRESIRKGRGRRHITQLLKTAQLHPSETTASELDRLIADATIDTVADDAIDTPSKPNWLRLAVEARSKKYGESIPLTAKDKAKQLRFLQYRGFELDVCFEALKYRPEDLLDE